MKKTRVFRASLPVKKVLVINIHIHIGLGFLFTYLIFD
mgnify:CR=1 FL=1